MIGKQSGGEAKLSTAPSIDRNQAAADVVRLIEAAGTAGLGTLDRASGIPYTSLVSVACRPGRVPVLLLSQLAAHRRNLVADARASLLFSADFGAVDPMTLPRVTLLGQILLAPDPAISRAAYLSRHPQAAAYADFGDFAFFEFEIARAHFIGGFGRIVELTKSDLGA